MTDTVVFDTQLVEIESQKVIEPDVACARVFDTVVVETDRVVIIGEDDVLVIEVDLAKTL